MKNAPIPEHVVFAHLEEPPFCFVNPDGSSSGCDVELASTILSAIGVKGVTFTVVNFDDLIPGLESRRFAMTTGFFITGERKKRVAFSSPIWTLEDGLLVRDETASTMRSFADFAAQPHARLAVVAGQVQKPAAIRNGVHENRIAEFPSQADATRAVVNGQVDAYLTVAVAHRDYIARNGLAGLKVFDVPGGGVDGPPSGGFGFNKSDMNLLGAVNGALERYLGSPPHRELLKRYGLAGSS